MWEDIFHRERETRCCKRCDCFIPRANPWNLSLVFFKLTVPQIASKDKDFRYMATSDLLNELQKDNFKLDSDTERKVSQIVLQQLDDASGDISGLAVKWFAISILFWNSFCSLFTKCCANEC
jgi:hypothetical protein